MTEVAITSPLKRVDRLRRKALLVGKDSRLHVLDLSACQPAKIIRDVSGESVYGSELALMPTGEILLSNGAALLACDMTGRCREVLRLEEVRLPDLPNPALERHIDGPIRFCSETQRVYFRLAAGRVGELPPAGQHGTYLCEFDLITRAVSSVRLKVVWRGYAVDGVSRVAYLPFEARTRRDMLKLRDRVLKKSLAGEPDEALMMPDCVERCELTPDREQLLCSHESCNCLITLVDCRCRSFLGFKRRRCKRLPFTGFNATFGPNNAIFFVREGFSLWRHDAGSKQPERLMEVRRKPGPGPMVEEYRPAFLPEGCKVVQQWARAPLVNSQMQLLSWRLSVQTPERITVVIDLLNGEYLVLKESWPQMALVAG